MRAPAPRRRRRRALFLVVLWLACLALIEVAVRLQRRGAPRSGDLSLDDEWRWAASHLAREGEATPGELSPLFMHDPVVGWRPRPLVRLPGVTTNSAGMRTSVEVPLARTPGRRRVLLVGDSYTWGDNVADEHTFGHLLAARHLPGWDVLNLGIPGSGTDQQLLMFHEHGRRFGPDAVVLGFFVRDYPRNLVTFRDYAKPRFVLEGDGLRLTNVPVLAPEDLLARYRAGERAVGQDLRWWTAGYALSRWREVANERVNEEAEGWLVLSRLMERFAAEVRAAGATPVWMLIPMRTAVEEGASKYDALEGLCERRAAALGMPFLSVTEALRARNARAPVNLPRQAGGHLSPAGNEVIAEALADLLPWLPPGPALVGAGGRP